MILQMDGLALTVFSGVMAVALGAMTWSAFRMARRRQVVPRVCPACGHYTSPVLPRCERCGVSPS